VKVPDEPFPKGNDAKTMKELSSKVLKNALVRWAQILGARVADVGVGYIICCRCFAYFPV
jgi:hypothetical protein